MMNLKCPKLHMKPVPRDENEMNVDASGRMNLNVMRN
jgi:hypothetical protein